VEEILSEEELINIGKRLTFSRRSK
jgi:hypothetical protein